MAQSAVTLNIDTTEFQAAIGRLAEYSKWNFPVFVNDQLQRLVYEAMKQTTVADVSKLRAELTSSFKVTHSKRGILLKKGKTVYEPNVKGYKFLMAWKRKHNAIFSYWERKEVLLRWINAHLRSKAFIKSGWIPSVKYLSAVNPKGARYSNRVAGAQQYGKAHGGAIVAKPGKSWETFAAAWNDALIPLGKLSAQAGKPMHYAESALRRAIMIRTADVKQAFEKQVAKMQNRWGK